MDSFLIHAFQRLAGVWPGADAFGVFCASVLVWVEAELVAVFWLADRRRRFAAVLSALAAALVGLLASEGIGVLYFRPRPFAELSGVKQLIAMSPLAKSFPSDHATIAFALATAVFLVNRRWGAVLLALAALVALGRIFVGVHYPSDALAGAVLGVLVAAILHRFIHKLLHTSHHRA